MKLQDLTETAKEFTTQKEWSAVMKEAGVEEFLREKEFNTDLIYAVAGTKLVGTWNDKKDTGVKYSGAGMNFDKRRRKFNKVKV